jgi:hypothetical protein
VAIASAKERAQATLVFLCSSTGATRGYLFLAHEHGLVEAANTGQGAPPADVLTEAERSFREEMDVEPDANLTRTIDVPSGLGADVPLRDQLWTSSNGVAFIRHVLGTYHGASWTPVGIAMLEAGPKLVPLRHAYVEVICNAFIAAGDVRAKPAEAPLTSP